MRGPRMTLYGLMKSLDVQWIPEHELYELEEILRTRIYQSQVSASVWYGTEEDWDTGIDDGPISRENLWSSEHKPHLGSLKVTNHKDELTSSLLRL